MIYLGAAVTLIICSVWLQSDQAGARTTIRQPITAGNQIDFPLGLRCVVTVDTRSAPKPEVAGQANLVTGFAAPDATEGILIRMDADWVVLRDGSDENWVPMNKVLLVHACN